MVQDTLARPARYFSMAVAVVLAAVSAFAQTNPQTDDEGGNPVQMTLTRTVPPQYTPGSALTVTISVDAPLSGDITAMGLTEVIPDGWTFNGMGALTRGVLPSVTPQPGAQGELDFAWIVIPQSEFPFVFTYLLDVPASAAGPQAITGFVEYRMQGPAHFSNEAVSQMSGFDKEPPVITLTGANPIKIKVGSSFTDPGATATDNVDGTVTVTTEGEVNPATAGTYTLTYSAKDKAGNKATPVTRTVVVEKKATNTGSGSTRNPRYFGGGGVYMPDDDLAGRTTTDPAAEGAGQAPPPNTPGNFQNQANQAGFQAGANQQGFTPANTLPTRSVTPIPAGDRPPITPTAPGTPTPPNNREFGKPKLTRVGEEPAKPAATTPEVATPPVAPEPAPVDLAAATTVAPPPEEEPVVLAQVTPDAAAEEFAAVPPPAVEGPGFLGGIAASFGSLSTQERLGLGVVLGIMVVIIVLSFVAYKYAYKPGPRRRTR